MHRIGILLLLLALVAGVVAEMHIYGQEGYDDAFISYRYALNLVHGHGLVYNPGERVEGYSNLLYTLLMALGLLVVPWQQIYYFSIAVNTACLCGALVVFEKMLRERTTKWAAYAGALLFAANPLLWQAAWSGMETSLVILLFVVQWYAVFAYEKRPGTKMLALLCGASILQILARADGFVLVGIFVVYLAFKRHWRAAAWCACTSLAVFGLHVAWRYLYYGYPLPNTYYVKVSGKITDRLVYAYSRFHGFTTLHPYLLLIAGSALVTLLVVLVRRRDPRRLVSFEVFFSLAWLAYWFYIGGDIFGIRFLLILFPVGYFLFAGPFRMLLGKKWLFAGVALFLLIYPIRHSDLWDVHQHRDSWIEMGKFLGKKYPGCTMAIDAAGKAPYFSELRTIDMLGLNDPVISHEKATFFIPGHNKKDPDYILSRKPDIICGWMLMGTLDFGENFRQAKYEKAGYRLGYVVYVWYKDPRGALIVNVAGMSDKHIKEIHYDGYRYGILLRKDLIRDKTPSPGSAS